MTIAISPPAVPDLLGTSPADLIDQAADLPVATRDVAVRRAERIRSGLASYAAMRQDIADAYAQRDWQALDHGSWHEYLERQFGEQLRALARDDRRQAVSDLRAQGMSTRQIASATGVSQPTVIDDLKVKGSLSPEAVTGADGKQYPATQPKTAATAVRPVADGPGADKPSDGPTAEAAVDAPAASAGIPERPKPPAWDPAERRQHEEEVLLVQDIRMAEQQSKTLVTDVRALVFTVLQGARRGARGLVTRDMIADLRKAIDLLEGEIDSEE